MRKKGELWNSGLKVVKECNRIASDFVEDQFRRLYSAALEKNLDFAYEGHFTNDASWTVPKMFKKSKYELNIIFFGLTDTSLSKARVLKRARERGHNVDDLTLRENFYGNLQKLDTYFILFDNVTIVDTSGFVHVGLVILKNGQCVSVAPKSFRPDWLEVNLPNVMSRIKDYESRLFI